MIWKNLLSPIRKIGEEVTFDGMRSPFEMDFDRIIFSHPFRRLQDKTQVHPLPEFDFVHTRLTHSLEVSSVGRSLGKEVGKVILGRHSNLKDYSVHDFGGIVAAASLAHDIGNPPFGHSGETGISDFFRLNETGRQLADLVNEKQREDLRNFEGNAQGFRILNKGEYTGLRLTFATLAAFSKYPRESKISKKDKSRASQKKYGFFQAEKEKFNKIAEKTGLINLGDNSNTIWSRHPLTFLVEAADDICYSVIDLEDGCRLGLVSLDETIELLKPVIGVKFDKNKLDKLKSREEKIGQLRALAINQLVNECCELFLDSEEDLLSADFDISLTNEIKSKEYLAEISRVSIEKIYRSRKVVETEVVGFEVLPGLLEMAGEAILNRAIDKPLSGRQKTILRLFPEIQNSEVSTYDTILTLLDSISGMTDTNAISFYRKLRGIDLPKG